MTGAVFIDLYVQSQSVRLSSYDSLLVEGITILTLMGHMLSVSSLLWLSDVKLHVLHLQSVICTIVQTQIV